MDDRHPRHLELISVAPDHVVVTFRTPRGEAVRVQFTPVGEGPAAGAVSVGGASELDPDHDYHWTRIDGLAPDTSYRVRIEGAPRAWSKLRSEVQTLRQPPGRPVARIAMTTDVHFGEEQAGRIEEIRTHPVLSRTPVVGRLGRGHAMPHGFPSHSRLMNEAAVHEMQDFDPDLVVVKGDLTSGSRPREYAEFREVYAPVQDRLVAFRGNHDALLDDAALAGRCFAAELNGVSVAVLDTVAPRKPYGLIDGEQLDWLRSYARASSQPVLVVGHHNLYMPRAGHGFGRTLFRGVTPHDTAALLRVIAEEPAIVGYFAGHTHKNLHNAGPRGVPIVETASAKEFPGTWAAYQVHEGGYAQTLYQISAPDALAWSVRTKELFFGLAPLMNRGRQSDRAFTYSYDDAPVRDFGRSR